MIIQICARFESALRTGRKADIKGCLSELPDEQRHDLFRELLKIELAALKPRKDEKEYLLEYPEFELIIREVLAEEKDAIVGSLESTTDANPSTLVLGDTLVTEKRRPLIVDSSTFIGELAEVGLLSKEQQVSLLAEGKNSSAIDLAKKLIRAKILTEFQAQIALRGMASQLLIGPYEILEKLDQGGMGAVYRGRHQQMDRLVAIKVLGAELKKSESARKRFDREVKAAARLIHPNIVTAFDAASKKGRAYLVMELVEGRDLQRQVELNGPTEIGLAIELMVQLATGLQFAHTQGIVHRDIKPRNLMLLEGIQLKILDFGIARIRREIADEESDASLTNTASMMGTVDYMPPEQALDSKSVDQRADIYSMGCVLHFLLTGRPAFEGSTLMQKLVAHREHPIPSLKERVGVNASALDPIFRRMLAKNPADRYQTAEEVRLAFVRLRSSENKKASNSILSNSIGMRFVRVPAGRFLMGVSNEDQVKWWAHEFEGPPHMVEISREFLLGEAPVTQAEYLALKGVNPSRFSVGQLDRPVENVSWMDVINFLNQLSLKEGFQPYYRVDEDEIELLGGKGYRLPTEAEWEYACRAGSETSWYFGGDRKKLSNCGWISDNSNNETHPVRKLVPNAFGLYDLYGNVWEWCFDLYSDTFYSASQNAVDPSGPTRGSERVIRGGSFAHSRNTRSSARSKAFPDTKESNIGFRIARTI